MAEESFTKKAANVGIDTVKAYLKLLGFAVGVLIVKFGADKVLAIIQAGVDVLRSITG